MTGRRSDAERRHLRWEIALDRLELDVLRAERMLENPERPAPASWDEPDLGPIPPDLVERATELRTRQVRVLDQLTTALGSVARHHEFAARVDRATRREGAAVFLDVSA